LENSENYECEHDHKITRKIHSEYTIEVCNKCYEEFTNLKTRPLFLAKQILSLSNKMIEKTPEFMNEQGLDKSIKLWHSCNSDVLEQLKKIDLSLESKNNKKETVEGETNYNFNEILCETEVNEEKILDGKNLHDLYRHSTKLTK